MNFRFIIKIKKKSLKMKKKKRITFKNKVFFIFQELENYSFSFRGP